MRGTEGGNMSVRHRVLVFVLLGSLFIAGCGAVEPTATSVPASATQIVLEATNTPLPPTATLVPPTATQTPLPPTSTPSPTETDVPPTETPVDTASPTPEPTPSAQSYEVIEDLPYIPDGDRDQQVTLYLPESRSRKPLTLLVLGGDYLRAGSYVAELGYPALSVGYRERTYRQDLENAFCVLAWTHANADTYGYDADHIVVLGGSILGNHAAMLAAIDEPAPYLEDCPYLLPDNNRLYSVILIAGALDLTKKEDFAYSIVNDWLPGYLGVPNTEEPEIWAEASPITWIDGSEPPFLLIHGTADVNVEPPQSERFATVLEEAGVEYDLVLLPNLSHTGIMNHEETFKAVTDFLDQLQMAGAMDPSAPLSLVDSGQRLGSARSWDVSLGDLDGDGDLDAFVANGMRDNESSEIWLNDGLGTFTASEQDLGYGMGVELGDLDGDGDLDAFLVSWDEPGKVWLNDGQGSFVDSGQILGSAGGWDSALGDLDGDGDLDAYVANEKANTVWLNDGDGTLIDTEQRLGGSYSAAVELGDLDGDGDLDALAVGWGEPGKVWLNDGTGNFVEGSQTLTSARVHIHGMTLGDVDGDGDLDTFLAGAPNQVWLNDGAGVFTKSEQGLVSLAGDTVALGDLDGDGDLDAFLAVGDWSGSDDKLWLNDGNGHFTDSDLTLSNLFSSGIGLGDLDGDGDLDAFVTHGELGRESGGGVPNEVWLNVVP